MARGYGKLILFGEHFVVYGAKAIATGLKDLYVDLEIKEGQWNKELEPETITALQRITQKLNINKSFSLKISSTLPVRSNLGSSAAFSVAFTRALNEKYSLNLSDERINELAYEAEKVFHGNPSGIDNTCATYGIPIIYKKGEKPKLITPKETLHIVIVNSGPKLKSTKQAVEHFAKMKEQLPNSEDLFNEYNQLIEQAISSIKQGDIDGIAKAINKNHELLKEFQISTENIERLREQLFSYGALASKITGAGFGGNIFALFPSKEQALSAKNKLSSSSWYTSI